MFFFVFYFLFSKVYGILSVQLFITFGFILTFALTDGTKEFARNNPWVIWASFIVSFASIITLSCCGDFRRKFPHNFICLGIFTIAQSIPLGIVSAFYDTKIVFLAVLITAIICVALTAFAWQTSESSTHPPNNSRVNTCFFSFQKLISLFILALPLLPF